MPPNRHIQAATTWAVVYPVLTLLIALLDPLLRDLPLPMRTLIVSAIMVPSVVYVAMPRVMTWLTSTPSEHR